MPMKHILTLLLFCSVLLSARAQQMTINFEDTTRDFIVHLPPSYTTGSSLPLVFNLHGYTSNAGEQMIYSGMNTTADANNFIVVYPNGLNEMWNSGFVPPYNGTFPNDVGFISKLIDTLHTLYNIDLNRVYSCGMSNGGFQSYRLACDLESRIAAIASVTGSMTSTMTSNCTLSRKVPVLEIHGTADGTVPYNGTVGIMPTEDVIDFWLGKNVCSTAPELGTFPNSNTTDASTVSKALYRTCTEGVQVWLYTVNGGGHTWPGSAIPFGVTNQDINASQEIWDFFNQFTLAGPVGIQQTAAKIDLNVFPNPANNVLNIQADEYISQVTVYNLLGEKVLSRSANAAGTQLNIANLHSGIYMLSIQAGGVTYTRRFTKD